MFEAAPSRWWSDWKAGITLIVLEMWLVASFFAYYKVYLNPSLKITSGLMIICGSVWAIINGLLFVRTDIWKEYVKEFDALPHKTNRLGTLIVLGVIFLIAANTIFSFYLLYHRK